MEASDIVIQKVAEEGITLLKNNGALPLDFSDLEEDEPYNVNLFGVGSTDSDVNGFYVFGGGSGTVSLAKEKTIYPKNALENNGFRINENLYNFFKTKQANPTVDWWNGSSAKTSYLNYAAQFSSTAIIAVSRFTGENKGDRMNYADTCEQSGVYPWKITYRDSDNDGRNFCQLSLKEEAMIKYCAENFENVIVIINSGNVMELGLLDELDGVDAIMYVPYTGQSGANAIGKILKGEVSPSGKTTDTFAYSSTEYNPSAQDLFYFETNGAKQIAYTEDIYIGYKWYETADKEGFFTAKGTTYDKVVQYPFGYGLSYTNFEWTLKGVALRKKGEETASAFNKGETITDKNDTMVVTVEVKNVGRVAGKEVVQLYSSAPYTEGKIEKPYIALTDFAKTGTLYPSFEAGEGKPNSETLTLEFSLYDIASYDCYDKNGNGFKGYELDGGEYTLSLRSNAHEVNACENAEFTFKIGADGFKFDKDPTTGYTVENRFTGETAEAGVPIDGSNDTDEKITYLSRADFAGTFPTRSFTLRSKGYDVTKYNGIGVYLDDSVTYKDLIMPTFNAERKLFLYTREDGSAPTLSDLEGKGQSVVPNEQLIMKLGKDYDAEEWAQLLSQLSVLEVKDIVTRHGMYIAAAEGIGKQLDRLNDGPAGINNSTLSFDQLEGVSAFPCEALAGMTWNKSLLREMGAAMGAETSKLAITGLYAPAIDVHRHQYNGRNFEQFGEDGVLVGKLGAEETYGMTTHGIQVSIKHFVISTPGANPTDYNSWITEQNLRESYLRTFERTVKEAGANFLMTSFNNIGGVQCALSYSLNTEILRNEWGFKGTVVTDYNVHTENGKTSASLIRAGNDLRFSGNEPNRKELDENNAVDMALAVRAVKNTIYTFCNTYYRTKTYDPSFTKTSYTTIPVFNWWIPSLIALNVLIAAAVGIMVFFTFLSKKGRSETVELVNAMLGKKTAQTVSAAATVAATTTTAKTAEKPAEKTVEKPATQVAVEPKAEETTKAKEDREIPLTPMSAPQKPLDTSSKDFASETDKNYFNGVKYQALSLIPDSVITEENGEVTIAVNGDKKLQIAVEDGRTAVYFYQAGSVIAKVKIVSLKTYREAMLLIG